MKFKLSRSRLIALVFIIPVLAFLVNLIWFRPFFISHFFYREMLVGLARDVQTATKVKVPYLYGRYKDQLNDQSVAKLETHAAHLAKTHARLMRYNDRFLNESKLLSKEIITWHMEKDLEGHKFAYHQFLLNPYNGEQNALPSYLDTYHYIENKSDAKAYLSRLEQMAEYFDGILERMEISRERKILPPIDLLNATIAEMEKFSSVPPEKNMLYTSFEKKLASCGEISVGDRTRFLSEASHRILLYVYPAYIRMINYCHSLANECPAEGGAWSLPDGNTYYIHRLRHHTTLDISPETIHRTGIKEMIRIKKELVDGLQALGIEAEEHNVMTRLNELADLPGYRLENCIADRYRCLAIYDSLINVGNESVQDWFTEFPRSELEVKRVPEFRQEGASHAYYEVPTLDGNGKGSFYVRMDNLEEVSVFEMPTLAFHEGIPGHHYQLALHLEKETIPIYRKAYYNNAYIEGWALYAERLMFELGAYTHDAPGNLGRLKAELARAARLVADTGIHYRKWTRETALSFLTTQAGMSRSNAETEVNRYISDPGQACAYYLGFMEIMELREKAKVTLGAQFELREFHQVILSQGMVPMIVLEKMVDAYIASKS